MRICIDSCVFIPGLQSDDSEVAQLLNLVGPALPLLIPRLVAQEVTRNLKTSEQVSTFYRLFDRDTYAFIIDEPVPRDLVLKYANLGLPQKADAFIGAFVEWLQIDYLISHNRHFLQDLQANDYEVVDPTEFLKRWSGNKKQ